MISALVGGILISWTFVGLTYGAGGGPAQENRPRHPRQWSQLPQHVSEARSDDIPYGRVIRHCNVPGTVALTFDDGPYIYTNHLLDVLEQHGAKATFFVNGDNLGRGLIDDSETPWPETLRRMHQAGHQIGSHTWSHVDLTAASPFTRNRDIFALEEAFARIFGWYPTYLRPPYGSCEHECQEDFSQWRYRVITWDIDTRDFSHHLPETVPHAMDIFSSAVSEDPSANSYIVLAHDVHEQTAYALADFMLHTLQDRGYRAVTVGECLGDPPENWYRRYNPGMRN